MIDHWSVFPDRRWIDAMQSKRFYARCKTGLLFNIKYQLTAG